MSVVYKQDEENYLWYVLNNEVEMDKDYRKEDYYKDLRALIEIDKKINRKKHWIRMSINNIKLYN